MFGADGYAMEQGIVIDLLHAYQTDLTLFLAHEFHHEYLVRANAHVRSRMDRAPLAGLAGMFWSLRNEGIADLIDKPYPFASTVPALAGYVTRYNREYENGPATLRAIDSLLTLYRRDTTTLATVAPRLRQLVWSNGHPLGAHMARTIERAFGGDSLIAAVDNPAVFVRAYASARRRDGHPDPFSADTRALLAELERRYWIRAP
jgi:hypothetical protein